MKRCILTLLTSLVLLASPVDAIADDILPAAQGRYAMAFVIDNTVPKPPVGAWVLFLARTHRDIPTQLRTEEGFVLGTKDNVVFVEVSQRDALVLADRQARQEIRLRKTRDPDPKMVAERRRLAENGQPFTLAPRLTTVTLLVEIPKDRIDAWKPGNSLTFEKAREVNRLTYRDDRVTSHYYDIPAQFVSAVQKDASHFEISVIVEPGLALPLSKASAEGRISIFAAGEPLPKPVEKARCYVTQRHKNERIQIQIPCS